MMEIYVRAGIYVFRHKHTHTHTHGRDVGLSYIMTSKRGFCLRCGCFFIFEKGLLATGVCVVTNPVALCYARPVPREPPQSSKQNGLTCLASGKFALTTPISVFDSTFSTDPLALHLRYDVRNHTSW